MKNSIKNFGSFALSSDELSTVAVKGGNNGNGGSTGGGSGKGPGQLPPPPFS